MSAFIRQIDADPFNSDSSLHCLESTIKAHGRNTQQAMQQAVAEIYIPGNLVAMVWACAAKRRQ